MCSSFCFLLFKSASFFCQKQIKTKTKQKKKKQHSLLSICKKNVLSQKTSQIVRRCVEDLLVCVKVNKKRYNQYLSRLQYIMTSNRLRHWPEDEFLGTQREHSCLVQWWYLDKQWKNITWIKIEMKEWKFYCWLCQKYQEICTSESSNY